MTPIDVARKLLAHGPLKAREFREITGWSKRVTHTTLQALRRNKLVSLEGDRRGYLYELKP